MISIRFLTKYLFILKAAADGWRVKYLGGDKFEFHKESSQISNLENVPPSCSEFVENYLSDFELFKRE